MVVIPSGGGESSRPGRGPCRQAPQKGRDRDGDKIWLIEQFRGGACGGAENTFPITTCVLRGQLPAALTKSTAQVFASTTSPNDSAPLAHDTPCTTSGSSTASA